MDPTVTARVPRPRRSRARRSGGASAASTTTRGDDASAPVSGADAPAHAEVPSSVESGAAEQRDSILGKADAERLAAAIMRVLRSLIVIALVLPQ